MSQSHRVRIGNPEFAVIHLLDNQPYKKMWVREVFKNCLQATSNYINSNEKDAPNDIHIRALSLDNFYEDDSFTAPKLSFLNPGGMSYDELVNHADLYSTGKEKTQSLEGNFGIGESSTLPQFTDVLKISCKGDRVYALIYYISGEGNDRRMIKEEPVDVTEWALENAEVRGYDAFIKDNNFVHSWTETILLGKQQALTHNTATHPNNDNEYDNLFLISKMLERFVDIPENIKIKITGDKKSKLFSGCRDDDRSTYFRTKNQIIKTATAEDPINCCSEEVQLENGTIIHYTYHGPVGAKNDSAITGTMARFVTGSTGGGLIYGPAGEKEKYQVIETHQGWTKFCNSVNIFGGSKYFLIDVELPVKDYTTNKYRTDVILRLGKEENMDSKKLSDFTSDIKNNMPQWFKDKVSLHDKTESVDISQIWNSLTEEFHEDYGPKKKKVDNGHTSVFIKPSRKNRRPEPAGLRPSIAKRSNANRELIEPEFKFTSDTDIQIFASFEKHGGNNGRDLFLINKNHYHIDKIMEKFEHKYNLNDYPETFSEVRQLVIKYISVYVARKVAITQSYNDVLSDFDYRDFTTGNALTVDAGTYKDIIFMSLKSTVEKMKQKAEVDINQ